MSNLYKQISKCRCCDSSDLYEVLDLGEQPLANAYINRPQNVPQYPLVLNVCQNCWHGQLSISVDSDEMFKDYAYVSGTSQTGKEHFKWLADHIVSNQKAMTRGISSKGSILDVGSNDASFLDIMADQWWDTYGVDPAENLCKIVREKGRHNITCDYWRPGLFDNPFDVITALNVFAHLDDIRGFLEACKDVMWQESLLYIQTSQASMMINGEYDTIYSEHQSFFSISSMKYLVEYVCGMKLMNVQLVPIHGGSYLFTIGLHENRKFLPQIFGGIDKLQHHEAMHGVYSIDLYKKFGRCAAEIKNDLRKMVKDFKDMGCRVIGAGAAAKGNTVLNYALNEAPRTLDYVIDENPLKIGKYIPGCNTPVRPFGVLTREKQPLIIVLTAWNFADEIVAKIAAMNLEVPVNYIKYFPKVRVI